MFQAARCESVLHLCKVLVLCVCVHVDHFQYGLVCLSVVQGKCMLHPKWNWFGQDCICIWCPSLFSTTGSRKCETWSKLEVNQSQIFYSLVFTRLKIENLHRLRAFFPSYLLHVWSTSVWQAARQWWEKQVADCVCVELFTATSTSSLSAYRQKVLLHVLIVNLPFYFLCTSSSLIRV